MKKLLCLIGLFFSLTSLSYASNEASTLSVKNQLSTLKIQGYNVQNNIPNQNFVSQINLIDGTKISSFRKQLYLASVKQNTTLMATITCSPPCQSSKDKDQSKTFQPVFDVQTEHLTPYYTTTMNPKSFQTGYAFTVKKVVNNQIYFQLVIRELLKMHELKNPADSSGSIEAPELYKIILNDVMSAKDNSWHYVYKPQTGNKIINQQKFEISITKDSQ